jgi:predicted transcriptional regulator
VLKQKPTSDEIPVDQAIHPGMPCYVANDAEFIAAVEIGLADLAAGRTVPFAEVAAEFRRTYGKT